MPAHTATRPSPRLALACIFALILAASGIFAASPSANAQQAVTVDSIDFSINVETSSATAIDYRGTVREVVIPSSVEFNDISYPVTAIGNDAFTRNHLTNVTIPDTVTTIGHRAFRFNSLSEVTLGNAVTSIGVYAFHSNFLVNVTVPDTVTSIGEYAFLSNPLAEVTIGSSVTSIDRGAFQGNNLRQVSIPDSVTTIGASAFSGNDLTEVALGNAVTTIGPGAFSNNELTVVTIGSAVATIGEAAFVSNYLTEVWFTGPAPTQITPAGNAISSLGNFTGLTVYYPYEYEGTGAGEYSPGIWQGYSSIPTNADGPVKWTVSFDTGGGTIVAPATVTFGHTLPRPVDPTRDGYTLTGWYTNPQAATAYDFSTPVVGNLTLYAGWEAVETPPTGLVASLENLFGSLS